LSFTLNTPLANNCLPNTGLFDSGTGYILVGAMLVILGLIANRFGLLLRVFGQDVPSNDGTSGFVQNLVTDLGLNFDMTKIAQEVADSQLDDEARFEAKVMRTQERKVKDKNKNQK